MFDIGFLEILMVGVVALLVVGPERLPRLARTLGLWIGRARRYAATVKDDVEREFRAHDIQQSMGGKPEMKDIYEIVEDAQETVRDVAESMDSRDDDMADRKKAATPPPAVKEAVKSTPPRPDE